MEFYHQIFKDLPPPCLLLKKEENVFIIKEANTAYCKLLEVNEEELIGKSFDQVFPENPLSGGLDKIYNSFEIAFAEKRTHSIERLRYDLLDHKTGLYKEKYWQIENTAIKGENAETQYILSYSKGCNNPGHSKR